ncbi:MAG TPA: chemotaxis protein CheX [Vicinamibacterales bacterium]
MLEVAERVSATTQELFASMMGLQAKEGPLIDLPNTEASTEIVAFVGLSGSSAGMVGVYSSSALACHIAGALLGEERHEVDDEVRDAFGEVANIIAGNVAIVLGDMGETIQLSLPTVIVGKFLVTSILNTVPPRRARKFSVDGEDLYVELALRRGED